MKELERASAEIQAGIRAQQEVFAELNATLQAVQGQANSLSQERLELQERRQAMEDHCKAVLNRIAVLEVSVSVFSLRQYPSCDKKRQVTLGLCWERNKPLNCRSC